MSEKPSRTGLGLPVGCCRSQLRDLMLYMLFGSDWSEDLDSYLDKFACDARRAGLISG